METGVQEYKPHIWQRFPPEDITLILAPKVGFLSNDGCHSLCYDDAGVEART